MKATNDPTTIPPMTIIQRRNIPGTLASSFSSDFQPVSIKPSSYTSLRDILPSPNNVVQSPKTPCYVAHSRCDILIRNRLVKEAAWAYLQPMSTSKLMDQVSCIAFGLKYLVLLFVLQVPRLIVCFRLSELERDMYVKG
nr:hypothetical protein [Tanacetum cinerariifolium]